MTPLQSPVSDKRHRAVLDAVAEALIEVDADQRIVFMNAAAEALVGRATADVQRLPFDDVVTLVDTPDAPLASSPLRDALADSGRQPRPARLARADGTTAAVECRALALPADDARPAGAVVMLRAVAETPLADVALRAIEADLVQAQHAEAIGRIAAGLAHDFNNLLTVMVGEAETVMERRLHPRVREALTGIQAAALGGSALTRQLLAFGRREAQAPGVVDVNDAIADTARVLRRIMARYVSIAVERGDQVPPAAIDRGRLDLILLNLAIHARNAMPQGGTLTVSARRASPNPHDHPQIPAGDYAVVDVADSGPAMDEEALRRIFLPFFTPRAHGTRSGLGLATVHASAKQAGGFMSAASHPARGTVFSLWLPAAAALPPPASGAREERALMGAGAILLIEDDSAVRQTVARLLQERGFLVAAAPGPAEAVALVESRGPDHAFDAVVTDVLLPGMDGPELLARLRRLAPGVPHLVLSGASDDELRRRGVDPAGPECLRKPFRANDLVARLCRLLQQAPG